MNPRKLLARLSPSDPLWTRGPGGIPEYTAHDIAQAVGLIHDSALQHLVLYRWAGHDGDAEEARTIVELAPLVYGFIRGQGWRASKIATCGITRAVLHEMHYRRHCASCCASGAILDGVCKDCGGAGVLAYSHAARARIAGMNEATYRRVWAKRYPDIFDFIDGLERRAISKMRRALTKMHETHILHPHNGRAVAQCRSA